jgi:hypothetical protein
MGSIRTTETPRDLKQVLQRVAISTQYPPFTWCYRLIYALALRLSTRRIKRISGVRAIYLRRGLAGARPLYGLSDIDLLVVVDGELSGRAAALVRHQYDLLRRVIPMLPEPAELGIYNREYFRLLYECSPFYRGRFDAGRRGWKRLHGEDIFRELPPPRNDARAIAWQELRPAWNSLSLGLIPESSAGADGNRRPPYAQRYDAYKAIAEAARACLLAQGEDESLSRDLAIVRAALVFPELADDLKEVRRLRKNLLEAKSPNPDALLATFLSLARRTLESTPDVASSRRKLRILPPPCQIEELLLSKDDLFRIEIAGRELGGVDRMVLVPRLAFDAVATLDLDPVELAGATTDAFDLALIGSSLPCAEALRRFNAKLAAIKPLINAYYCHSDLAIATRPGKGWAIVDQRRVPEFYASLNSSRPLCGRLEIADAVEVERPFDQEDALELRARMLLSLFGKSEAFQLPVRSYFSLFWEAGRAFSLAAQARNPLVEVPATSAQIVEALAKQTPTEEAVLRRIHAEYWKEARRETSEAERYMFWASRYALLLLERLCSPGSATVKMPAEARMQLTISVAIVTRNRAALLSKALQSLVEQERPPDQVVVVDNASTDETDSVARSFEDRLNIRLVREEQVGIPIARNTSLQHSTGDIVALLDDDCIADRRWLAEIELPFLRDPHIAAVGGRIRPVEGKRELVARFYDDHMRDSAVTEADQTR